MSKQYCAFLRGVNVKGVRMKMDALKTAFSKMGLLNIKTVLASGNVIFETAEGSPDGAELKARIENELGGFFSYDAHVFLRDRQSLLELLFFAKTLPLADGCHQYVLLGDDDQLFTDLKLLFDSLPPLPEERLFQNPLGTVWIVPKGQTLTSAFGAKTLGNKRYQNRLTSRNVQTLLKIARAMG